MPKGYWVSVYRTISDPEKLAAYNKLAAPAVKAGGGRTFVRGGRVVAHDAGIAERTVLIEFDSFEQVVAAHESAAHQDALVALSGAYAVRGLTRVYRRDMDDVQGWAAVGESADFPGLSPAVRAFWSGSDVRRNRQSLQTRAGCDDDPLAATVTR